MRKWTTSSGKFGLGPGTEGEDGVEVDERTVTGDEVGMVSGRSIEVKTQKGMRRTRRSVRRVGGLINEDGKLKL